MQINMTKLLDGQRKRIVQGLSKEAQIIAAKLDTLRENQDITPAEEIQQVNLWRVSKIKAYL